MSIKKITEAKIMFQGIPSEPYSWYKCSESCPVIRLYIQIIINIDADKKYEINDEKWILNNLFILLNFLYNDFWLWISPLFLFSIFSMNTPSISLRYTRVKWYLSMKGQNVASNLNSSFFSIKGIYEKIFFFQFNYLSFTRKIFKLWYNFIFFILREISDFDEFLKKINME